MVLTLFKSSRHSVTKPKSGDATRAVVFAEELATVCKAGRAPVSLTDVALDVTIIVRCSGGKLLSGPRQGEG